MTGDTEAALDRQEMIWGGLYGPPRAKEMVAEARARLAADPDLDLSTVVAALDPEDDEGDDEAGLSRPGVG